MRKVRISFSCVGIPKFCYVKYHLLFNPFPFPFAVNSFSNGPFLLWWFTETSECKLKGVFIMLLYFLQLRQSLEVKKTSLILHKKNQLKENLSQVTIRVNMTTLFREKKPVPRGAKTLTRLGTGCVMKASFARHVPSRAPFFHSTATIAWLTVSLRFTNRMPGTSYRGKKHLPCPNSVISESLTCATGNLHNILDWKFCLTAT